MSPSPESSLPPEFPPVAKTQPAPGDGRFRFSKVFARWWWLGTLFVAAITFTVAMIPTWMEMDGPLYESTALIEVKPIIDIDPLVVGTGTVGASMNRQFMNTQFEIISAAATLELALAKNDLLHRLGGEKNEAIQRMQKSIRTGQRRGTDLMEISYRDENAQLACDAATAVVDAFKERRYELEMSTRKEQLNAIKIELQKKNDRVAELRKRLMEIAGKVGVIWTETAEGFSIPGADAREVSEKKLYQAEREKEELVFQLKRLSVADKDSVLASAESLKDGNDYISRIHERYLLRESELDALKSAGLAKEHPKIKQYTQRLLEAENVLKLAVGKEIEALKARVAMVDTRLQSLKNAVSGQQDQGTEKARMMQEFNVARMEYQTALNIKDQMEVKYDIEKTKTCLPPNNIIVHEMPEQAGTPVTRGREFFVTLGTVCSLPFSIGLGILLMYVVELIIPRKG
ncbi:MAG: hypothetical protein H7A51_19550 [Akkermansiaceae bacterium]|nr:hypothetical protein [Akkermansiaceae bacterium]